MLKDWLSRPSATATPATPATHEGGTGRGVATVAPVAVATPQINGGQWEPYTQADLAAFDALIRDDCARQRMDPEPYLTMRRRLAPARVMAELREYRAAAGRT